MHEEIKKMSIEMSYEIDKSFDSDKFLKLNLRICHDGTNPNNTSFCVDVLNNAKESIKNIPILASVVLDEDDKPQLNSHDMHIEENKLNKKENRLVYDETPVGVVPESTDFQIKNEDGRNYVYATCFIWKGYSNYTQDLIEKEKTVKLSMEVIIDSFIYDSKSKIYEITAFRFKGITLLGNHIGTGMLNARASTEEIFSNANQDKLYTLMSELKEEIVKFEQINNIKEGRNLDKKLKLLTQYNLTVEQLEFSIEEMTLEDLEAKLKEFSIDANSKETNIEDNKPEFNYSATFIQKYSALEDIIPQWSYEKDEENNYIGEFYYRLNDFDDDFAYVTKIHWDRDGDRDKTNGRFAYSFDQSTYKATLTSDFELVFSIWLTQEEKEELESDRKSYEQLKTDFGSYKEEYKTKEADVEELRTFKSDRLKTEREEAEQEVFSQFEEKLNNNEDFKTLKSQAKDYSIEELTDKCFSILGKISANFSLINDKKQQIKLRVDVTPEKETLYGGLYEKYIKTN